MCGALTKLNVLLTLLWPLLSTGMKVRMDIFYHARVLNVCHELTIWLVIILCLFLGSLASGKHLVQAFPSVYVSSTKLVNLINKILKHMSF